MKCHVCVWESRQIADRPEPDQTRRRREEDVPDETMGRPRGFGVQRLCRAPPLYLALVETRGFWSPRTHPMKASLDCANTALLRLMYTMRDACFDCDDEQHLNTRRRPYFLNSEYARLVRVANAFVLALGEVWAQHGGSPSFVCPQGMDGSKHDFAVEVIAQVLIPALQGLRWGDTSFYERALQEVCMGYVKSLGLVLVAAGILPRSMRRLLLPRPTDQENDELLRLLKLQQSSCDLWGSMLFTYAKWVCVCYRPDLTVDCPNITAPCLCYCALVSRQTQAGLAALRALMSAFEAQQLDSEPVHMMRCSFHEWKQAALRMRIESRIEGGAGAGAWAPFGHHALPFPGLQSDHTNDYNENGRIGPPAPAGIAQSMLLRAAVGFTAHRERPPDAITRSCGSNKPGRLLLLQKLAARLGLSAGVGMSAAPGWPLITNYIALPYNAGGRAYLTL